MKSIKTTALSIAAAFSQSCSTPSGIAADLGQGFQATGKALEAVADPHRNAVTINNGSYGTYDSKAPVQVTVVPADTIKAP